MNELVQYLLGKGYEMDEIKEYEDFYLVEDDLIFSKDMELPAPSGTHRNFHSNNLVSSNYIGNGNVIRIYSELPGPTGFGTVGTTWDEAVDVAIVAWNGIPDACVIFQRTTNPSLAHITVKDGTHRPLAQNHFGWAGVPSASGAPFHTVWINMQYPSGGAVFNAPIANTSMVQKRNIIVHELGHCIGFEHSNLLSGNAIPGTGGFDANSIMRGGLAFEFNTTVFSPFDIIAVRWLYGSGDCVNNDPPPASVTLNPVTPFCYPATFNASGTYSSSSPGAVTVSLQVMEITGGLAFYQTIATGQFSNGVFSFNNIDLNSIPGFNFNPNNPYLVQAVVTSPFSATSSSQNLTYDDCSDPCVGGCNGLQDAIRITIDFTTGAYTFNVANSVLNHPCAANFSYEWYHPQSNGTSNALSFSPVLSPGLNTIDLYVGYNGVKCYKETVTVTI